MAIPTQNIEFLGMIIDSRRIELRVPDQKIKEVRLGAVSIQNCSAPPTARKVSHILGKLNTVFQAIPRGPLFHGAILRDLAKAQESRNQCYNAALSSSYHQ